MPKWASLPLSPIRLAVPLARRIVWSLAEQGLVQPDALARLAARGAAMAKEGALSAADAHTLVSAFNRLNHCSSDVAALAALAGMGECVHVLWWQWWP